MKRKTSGAPETGLPSRALVAFNAEDWPDDGTVPKPAASLPPSPALVLPLPPDLAADRAAWHRWKAARQTWEDEHGWWPTGSVERWVEERQARPGGAPTGLAPWDNTDPDFADGGWA